MAKKQSESSQRGKPVRVSAESIRSTALSKRQALGDEGQIDYSDIPALSDKQLAQFKRASKKLVAVRLDADVFEWIRQFGAGYSTRINEILRVVMEQQR